MVFLLLPGVAFADAFEDALAAIDTGDYAAAVTRLVPLAEDGHAAAQYQLGALYDHGQGVTQDATAAHTWFRAAATRGFAPAQFALAGMYYEGRAVPQDYVLASMWATVAMATGGPDTVDVYGRFRDALRSLMTPGQIADAATRARRCIEAQFEACD